MKELNIIKKLNKIEELLNDIKTVYLKSTLIFISDIADRYSILLLKSRRTNENLENEIELYKNIIHQYGDGVNYFIDDLYNVNSKIWDLEYDIRRGKENELGLDEVGKRAIEIRDLNKQRIAIKNRMVDFYNEGFHDIKINHASSDKLTVGE